MRSLIEIPEKMDSLVLHGVGDLRYEQTNTPIPKDGEVLLEIKACGICSSDIPRIFVNGTYHFPTIPGHEFSGRIVAVGGGVDESLLGKRSCVFPMLPCRKCKACLSEEWAQCSGYSYFGSRCDGGFAQYLAVPVWNLVPFSDDLPYEVAALCEPSAVSLHAVNIGGVKQNDNIAVIGTGTIGFLIASFAAKRSQGGRVMICGRSQGKLDYAEKLGFETINISEEDIASGIKRITGSDGADVVFEAVGSNTAIADSIKAAAALGKVVLVGNPESDLALEKNVYWSVLRKQLTIAGSWNSSYNSRINDWKQAIDMLENGGPELRGLITHTFSMDKAQQAFDTIKDRSQFTLKVMFTNSDK